MKSVGSVPPIEACAKDACKDPSFGPFMEATKSGRFIAHRTRLCREVEATYRPGDLPPEGYPAWHEWADVQRKARIKQVECGNCGRWKTPQELSVTGTTTAVTRHGKAVTVTQPLCNDCERHAQRRGR